MGGAASGSFASAGGIGGLLAVSTGTADEDYLYMYDANGNVGQLVAWATGYGGASSNEWHADRLVATYEYDAYGKVLSSSGTYAAANPFRFSTKWFDDESGLGYWGYRYYSPRLGRWLSRDPARYVDGPHLYVYVHNGPSTSVDSLGRWQIPGPYIPAGVNQCWPASCRLPRPRVWGNCSDCWATCTSTAGQAMGGGGLGVVICRPDGCRCACVSTAALLGESTDATARRIIETCVLQHEEGHINDSRTRADLARCPPGGKCGSCGALIVGGRGGTGGRNAECPNYGIELQCLTNGRTGCTTPACTASIDGRIDHAIRELCITFRCAVSSYTANLPPSVQARVAAICPPNLR
jgi:RHS repeat-associated protein